MELLGNAWSGWVNYMTQGKLVALFITVLLYLWFGKKNEKSKPFVCYATVMAVCCIVPVTAVILMTYQTKFYDYEWIWSMVPMTVVIAYGLTDFLTEFCLEGKAGKKSTRIGVALLCLVMVLLCGSMGADKEDSAAAYVEMLRAYGWETAEKEMSQEMLRRQAYDTLAELEELTGGKELLLWAPMGIMEYAREADSRIRLPYGRNMWDASLNGYSYDTYEDAVCGMYLWMEFQNITGNEEHLLNLNGAEAIPTMEVSVGKAMELGVNCIMLPGKTDRETVQRVAEMFGGEVQQIEEYWVIYE